MGKSVSYKVDRAFPISQNTEQIKWLLLSNLRPRQNVLTAKKNMRDENGFHGYSYYCVETMSLVPIKGHDLYLNDSPHQKSTHSPIILLFVSSVPTLTTSIRIFLSAFLPITSTWKKKSTHVTHNI